MFCWRIIYLFATFLSQRKRNKRRQIPENLKEKEGVKVRDVLFTFGRYDGVIIFEAPNEKQP